MLLDYRTELTPERRRHFDACKEVLKAIEPQVTQFMATHQQNSKRWFPHEILPWGKGIDFNEVPWAAEQSPVRPEIVVALDVNLLTEDNLPYYHAQIEKMVDPDSIWQDWNRLWTAEEGTHAQAMRDYMYLLRVMDPYEMERNRVAMMTAGFDREFGDPIEVFAYTTAQELATRVSHLRTGQRADEPVVLKLLQLISRDENFHYVFYRSVMTAVLEIAPELALPAIMKQFYSFSMPGVGMSNFELKQATIANAGIYGAREHRDQVVMPILNFWQLDKITGLRPEIQKVQERILKLEKVMDRMVERQERRERKGDVAT